MKPLMPLATAIASAAALTVPALADATTYCVAKPECVTAGGTDEPTLGLAFGAAATTSPGQDRIEIGPGDFTAGSGGFLYQTSAAGEGVDIVGSGQGVTRLLNSSTKNVERTLQLNSLAESSVSDLTVVAPTPSGVGSIDWGLITSATVRHVTIEGAHDYIAAQLNSGARLEDSVVHGDPAKRAVTALDGSSVSGSTIETAGMPIGISSGHLDITRTRIDARTGPIVSGNASLTITDSLVLTHGGPGLWASTGVNAILNATGDTVVGDDTGSAGLIAGEGPLGHNAHVTLSNTTLSGYGHSIIANASGGGVDVKLSHSDYDDTTVIAAAGQIDATEPNTHDAPAFVDPASGDYHLQAASPLVDAGDPATAS